MIPPKVTEQRTKEIALLQLHKALAEVKEVLDDPSVGGLLTEILVDEVFDIAWKYQFAEDRGTVSRYFRDIVRERIAGVTEE